MTSRARHRATIPGNAWSVNGDEGWITAGLTGQMRRAAMPIPSSIADAAHLIVDARGVYRQQRENVVKA